MRAGSPALHGKASGGYKPACLEICSKSVPRCSTGPMVSPLLEKSVPVFLFGDQTQDKNEKAGKQKVHFRAVVFDFPRF